MARKAPLLPLAVRRILTHLGEDLQRARKRRRLTAELVAERAQISRPTLRRVERGDPAVSLGIYATVLWVLGLADRLGKLAASETDVVGLGLEDERLPQRVPSARRRTRKKPAPAHDHSPATTTADDNEPAE